MKKGVKAKDIRDFEKKVAQLSQLMERIRLYLPEAHIYATPGELNLMSGTEDGLTAREEQERFVVTTMPLGNLETGDW